MNSSAPSGKTWLCVDWRIKREVLQFMQDAEQERIRLAAEASRECERVYEDIRQRLEAIGFDAYVEGYPSETSINPGMWLRHPESHAARGRMEMLQGSSLRDSIRALTSGVESAENELQEARRRAVEALAV